jgi:hypothetical protein
VDCWVSVPRLLFGARHLAPWLARWISPDSAGAVDSLNLYIYVGNNPLKYTDPTGNVKVYPPNTSLPHYEIDALSPIEGAYQNNNLFYFPESYERLENIVKAYPTDKFNLIDDNTRFSIMSDNSSNGELIIEAYSHPSSDHFTNIMNFSTGELVFDANFKSKHPDRRSGLNATEVTSYQYLGMTKIAGALNMLPKTMLRQNITNPSTNEVIKIYKTDKNYPRFYNNFLRNSDNGRSSLRITNTFSLEVTSIKLKSIDNNIRHDALPILGRVIYHQQKTTLTLSKSLETHYLKALNLSAMLKYFSGDSIEAIAHIYLSLYRHQS